MGEAASKLKALSSEDRLREEMTRALKHEYVDGQVYLPAGATDRHNRIVTNVSGHLWLGNPWRSVPDLHERCEAACADRTYE